ncbi:MAG: DUF418 domain-containing protein [Bacteroidales bacterium]|nr:DUF418 domain-containing protein [Bacteroidales bacterium]
MPGKLSGILFVDLFGPVSLDRFGQGDALGVYALEIAVSTLWLKYLRFGPVEWVWRMLTYGQRLQLKK